jgi:hypothetical protein
MTPFDNDIRPIGPKALERALPERWLAATSTKRPELQRSWSSLAATLRQTA